MEREWARLTCGVKLAPGGTATLPPRNRGATSAIENSC